MPEHVDILSANCHEPKHITSGSTADTGKVITNSSTIGGVSEYRKLTEADIDDLIHYVSTTIDDISTAGSVWVTSPTAGEVVSFSGVLHGPITVADATVTAKINSVNLVNGVITVPFTGSAAGDVELVNPTASNAVGAAGAIEVTTDGASTGTVPYTVTLGIRRA